MNKSIWTFLLLVPACSTDGTTVDVENPSSFCRAASDMDCAAMYTCLTDAERVAKKLPATEAECQRKFESACENAIDSCNASSTHAYASAAAATCLAEMQDATCSDAGEPFLDGPSCPGVCATTAGAFTIQWAFSPSTYSCSSLGISTVSLVTAGPNGKGYADEFDCYAGSGVTDALPVGTYAYHLELRNSSNQLVWSDVSSTHKLDDDVVDLGTVTIPVSH